MKIHIVKIETDTDYVGCVDVNYKYFLTKEEALSFIEKCLNEEWCYVSYFGELEGEDLLNHLNNK